MHRLRLGLDAPSTSLTSRKLVGTTLPRTSLSCQKCTQSGSYYYSRIILHCSCIVTSLEGAVRRLQDALRDSRDEIKELKDENKRLTAALENSGIDPRRWSRSPIPPATLGENLQPPYSHGGLTTSPSLRNSPSHGADFSLTYATSSVSRSSRSPIPNEQQQSASYFSASSPYDTTNVSGDQATIFPPDSYSAPLNLVTNPEFLTSASGQHSRQVSLEGPGRFDFRPASAAGSDSSATGPAPFKRDVDARSDNSSLSDTTPAPHGQAPLGMEMGFNDISLFNPSIGSLPMDYGTSVQHQPAGQATAAWDTTFYPESTFASQNNNRHQQQQETDLGRSDTVKASNYSTINRKISKGSQKHRRAYSSTADLHEMPPETSLFIEDHATTANPYEFERFNRPGSASSGYSVGGDLGHGFPESSSSNPPGTFAPSQLSRVKSTRRHSFPVSAASPDAYGTESSEDFEMDYEQPPAHYSITGASSGREGFPTSSSGIAAAAAAAAAASSKDPSMPPMSNTLAVIKAQAFGTVRKSRVRARRSGADSAAKVAMEALQARGLGMGLEIELDLPPTASGETSVSGRRQRQRKDEPS